MTDRGLPIVDGAPACPFVAFEDDRDGRALAPDHRHRCFAEPRPAPRALAHQEAYCLASAFPVCPTFQDWARREAAAARPGPADARPAREDIPPVAPVSTPLPPRDRDPRRAPGIDTPPPLPPRRNPQRDWAAPPPWSGNDPDPANDPSRYASPAAPAAAASRRCRRCRGVGRRFARPRGKRRGPPGGPGPGHVRHPTSIRLRSRRPPTTWMTVGRMSTRAASRSLRTRPVTGAATRQARRGRQAGGPLPPAAATRSAARRHRILPSCSGRPGRSPAATRPTRACAPGSGCRASAVGSRAWALP